ncbi:Hypothetical predicted protein [Podarcis lilfordi]|uniref:Uncharacterized protein n=1 Tax=Podarcis lilfordi TaxID=74358 RepID=A0AA35K310_9SAUR|nr:Hypothetical predicted protein [Podarcis lilfordi]
MSYFFLSSLKYEVSPIMILPALYQIFQLGAFPPTQRPIPHEGCNLVYTWWVRISQTWPPGTFNAATQSLVCAIDLYWICISCGLVYGSQLKGSLRANALSPIYFIEIKILSTGGTGAKSQPLPLTMHYLAWKKMPFIYFSLGAIVQKVQKTMMQNTKSDVFFVLLTLMKLSQKSFLAL